MHSEVGHLKQQLKTLQLVCGLLLVGLGAATLLASSSPSSPLLVEVGNTGRTWLKTTVAKLNGGKHGAVSSPIRAKSSAAAPKAATQEERKAAPPEPAPAPAPRAAPAQPQAPQPPPPLEFEVLGMRFRNSSLGFDHRILSMGHQCHHAGSPPTMQYTPNRAWPGDASQGRTALVMAIDTERRFLERFTWRFPSWKQHFLPQVAASTAMVLLLDGNYSSSNGTRKIAQDLQLDPLDCTANAATCKTLRSLDAGYDAYTANLTGGKKFIIFMSVARFATPFWVLRRGASEQQLTEQGWTTQFCQKDFNYYKSASWPRYPMMRLQILSFFHYFLKVDDDIEFRKAIPFDLGLRLMQNRSVFTHTRWLNDDPACQAGEHSFLQGYLDTESQKCGRLIRAAGEDEPFMKQLDTNMWVGNFVAGSLSFFTSPEQLQFAQAFHNAPGSYINRWQEQGFWPATVGLFHNASSIISWEWMRSGKYFCHRSCSSRPNNRR